MSADYVWCLLLVVAAGTLTQSMNLRKTYTNDRPPLLVGGRNLEARMYSNPVSLMLRNCRQLNSRLGKPSSDTRYRVLKVYKGKPFNGTKATDAIIKTLDKLGTASNDTEVLRKWRLESICCVKFSKGSPNNSSGEALGSESSTKPSLPNQHFYISSARKLPDFKVSPAYATRYHNFTPEIPSRIGQTTEDTPNNARTVEPNPETTISKKISLKVNHTVEAILDSDYSLAVNLTDEAAPRITVANISKTTTEDEYSWGRFDIDGTPSNLENETYQNRSQLNFRLSTSSAKEFKNEPIGARSSEEGNDDVDAATIGLETGTSTPVQVTALNGRVARFSPTTQTSLDGDNYSTIMELNIESTMMTPRSRIAAARKEPNGISESGVAKASFKAISDIEKIENQAPVVSSLLLPKTNNETYDEYDYNYYYDYDPIAVKAAADIKTPPKTIPTEKAPTVPSQPKEPEDDNHTPTSTDSNFKKAGFNRVYEATNPTAAVFVIPAQVSYGNRATFVEDFDYDTESTAGKALTPEIIKTPKAYHSSYNPTTQTSPEPTSLGRITPRKNKIKILSSIAPTITKSSNKPEITTASTNATSIRALTATTPIPSSCSRNSTKLADILLSLPREAARTRGWLEKEQNRELLFKKPSSSKIIFNDDGTLLVKYYYN